MSRTEERLRTEWNIRPATEMSQEGKSHQQLDPEFQYQTDIQIGGVRALLQFLSDKCLVFNVLATSLAADGWPD